MFSVYPKIISVLLFVTLAANSQVGVGTTSPQAALDVVSATNGMLVPRVALTAKNVQAPIVNPQALPLVAGTLVWNTATSGASPNNVAPGFYYWNGSAWVEIGSGAASQWALSGNAGTTPGTNFVGTTDTQDLRLAAGAGGRFNIGNVTGQFSSLNLGSAGSPTYSWYNDLNTGLFSPAADNLGLTTAGTERVRIEADGDVGIGTTPVASAKLQISATDRGLLIPNVALTAKNAAGPVTAPATSLLVYNTATAGTSPNNVVPGFHYWNGSAWVALTGLNSNDWGTTGNSGMSGGTTSATGTNFIGTTDSNYLNFRTNNNVVGRFSPLGEFFVGSLNTVIAGDLMNAVGNASFPWPVNGYTSYNGGAIYGSIQGGTAGWGALQGEYYGTSTNGNAVRGINVSSVAGTAIWGQYAGTAATGTRIGVRGQSNTGLGNQQIGVYGDYNGSAWGMGIAGIGFGGAVPGGNFDFAIVGWSSNNSNYSGYFNGNHVIANGTKSASVATSKGNQLLYVTETPEVWFEDIGTAKLVNGMAEVKLDPLFLETVFIDDGHPMNVFLQEQGESNGLYFTPGKDGFVVREKFGGTSNIAFSYRIMAKRRNFQDHRFGNDPVWGEGDTRKYSQYAVPPPVDYKENVKFQEEQKRNFKPTPLPVGFKDYLQIQNENSQPATRPKIEEKAKTP